MECFYGFIITRLDLVPKDQDAGTAFPAFDPSRMNVGNTHKFSEL